MKSIWVGLRRLISALKYDAPSSDILPSTIVVLQAPPNSFTSDFKRLAKYSYRSDTNATGEKAETDGQPSTSGDAPFSNRSVQRTDVLRHFGALLHDVTLGLWQN